jgi:hypothetical protein
LFEKCVDPSRGCSGALLKLRATPIVKVAGIATGIELRRVRLTSLR